MTMHALRTAFLGIAIGLAAVPASAWTVQADFEDGSPGAKADGADGFTEAFSRTIYSAHVAHGGAQSAELGITAMAEGFGEWGGSFFPPDVLREGDELWFRVYLYFPVGFDFSCTQCAGVKTLRIHTAATANGNNEGYLDVLIDNGLNIGSEVTEDHYTNNPDWKGRGAKVPTGTWMALEQYVKLSSTPGQGIYRVWQDGTLVFEDTITETLRSATSVSDFLYVFSYWNGGAPATQLAYIDDVVLTNEVPAKVDAMGHPFIGVEDSADGPGAGGGGGGGGVGTGPDDPGAAPMGGCRVAEPGVGPSWLLAVALVALRRRRRAE